MRALHLAGSAVAAGLFVTTFALAAAHAPPLGWEAPPKLKPVPKPKMPACCGTDATCCERQMLVNDATHPAIAESADVELSSIPLAVVREAKDGEPSVADAPTFHFVDGRGTPAPWKDGAKGEIRVLPPGDLGVLRLGAQGWLVPHFEKPEMRSLGYGDVRSVDESGRGVSSGPFMFTAMKKGEGGKIVVDRVEGSLDADLRSDVRRWMHVEAIGVFRATLFAYREPTKDGERLHVVAPESRREIESLGVDVEGTDVPSRFARRWPYGDFSFPVHADLGKIAVFDLEEGDVRHFRDVGARPDADWSGRILLDVNGTEGGPSVLRVRRSR